ncbi:MAG: hypothetical protein H6R40_1206 [Gemmatimonadetes bacterium]|nr:hypothetical protein [Gemmatimonadota bacterium]
MIRRVAVLLAVGWAACGPSGRRDHLQTPAIGNADARVVTEVLNAAGSPPRPGLARIGARTLREAGIDVVFYGTADTTVDSTLILVRRGDRRAGERIARALGGGKVRDVPDTLPRVDVTVLLGRDWIPPPDARP